MADAVVPALVSIDEYLHTAYKPDVDFVDGVLEQNNAGQIHHSAVQRRLLVALCSLGSAMRERVFPGTRVQVSPSRFRVPDLCVLQEGWTDKRIIRHPPVLCLEILSSEDRLSRGLRRARDFFTMGVPEIWIFDPEEQKAYRLLPGTTLQEVTGRLQSLSGEISLELSEVFRPSAT